MTRRGYVTLQPGHCGRAGGRRSLRRRSRRALELPDRAAGRDRRRHGGARDGSGARRARADAAQPQRRLRGPGAPRPGRDRGRGAAPGSVDVAGPARRCAIPAPTPGFDALAVFGRARGLHVHRRAVPDGVQPPLECPSFRDPPPPEGFEEDHPWFNFWEHVEGRPTLGHAPWEDYEPTSSLRASWYRFDDPPRADDGTWDPLALVALCDTMPGAVGERLGPGGPPAVAPAERRPHRARFGRSALRLGARGQPGPPRRRRLRVGRHGALGRRRRRIAPGGLRHPDDGVQLPEMSTPPSGNASATLATQSEPGVHLLTGKGLRGGPRRDGLPGAPGSARPSPQGDDQATRSSPRGGKVHQLCGEKTAPGAENSHNCW